MAKTELNMAMMMGASQMAFHLSHSEINLSTILDEFPPDTHDGSLIGDNKKGSKKIWRC